MTGLSCELLGVIIGGVIGIVSSLVAVLLSDYLAKRRETREYLRAKIRDGENALRDIKLHTLSRIEQLADDGETDSERVDKLFDVLEGIKNE